MMIMAGSKMSKAEYDLKAITHSAYDIPQYLDVGEMKLKHRQTLLIKNLFTIQNSTCC